MSEENEEIKNNDDDLGEDSNSKEAPWQIQDLHELLTLSTVEEKSQNEFQHILALDADLSSMTSFYQAYVRTFNDIHNRSQARGDRNCRTVPFSEEFYYSLPTPIEELVLHVLAKARELQSSNRFPEYDFVNHMGNFLTLTQDPAFSVEPISETNRQQLIDFNIATQARQDRYLVRGEAFNN